MVKNIAIGAKVVGSIPGAVKSDTTLATAGHCCGIFFSCPGAHGLYGTWPGVAQAHMAHDCYNSTHGSVTRYTLGHSTASIMKILNEIPKFLKSDT